MSESRMSDVKPEQIIAVWFSCGAASAVAAKLTIEKYGSTNRVRVINSPVMEEPLDNRRFLRDVGEWLGVEIELATNPKYPVFSAELVWEQRRYMAGNDGAPCTLELKKRARQLWEKENLPDWHVLGFAAEERSRFDRFVLTERENTLPVLIDASFTRQDCFDYLVAAGIALPDAYLRGYPNANCIGCVKATSPTYWNHVRRNDPDVFSRRAEQSRRIGARLVRVEGQRIFLDELSPNVVGRPMKKMTIECGIFCEERGSDE
jgi:hypothetical protein